MIEVRKEFEIVGEAYYKTVREKVRDYNKMWVSVGSLLDYINKARDEGNIEGERGFSASLFLSQLIKELENEE